MLSKIIFTFVLSSCLMLGVGYGQEKKIKTKEYHLRKAKRDKTVALITGGVSVAALAGGIIYGQRDGEGIGEVLDNGLGSTMLYITSITTGLTSIGFAIGSGVHREKAATIEPIAYSTFGNTYYGVMPPNTNARVVHAGVLIRF